jgi:DNA ligase (NAD+)
MLKIVDKKGLNIVGLSESIIKNIINHTISNLKKSGIEKVELDPFSILLTRSQDFKNMGYTEKMANKLSGAISVAIKNVKPANFLYACNIPGLGYVAAEQIMKNYDNDIKKFIKEFKETGKDIHGIGDVLYKNIADNLETIERESYFVSFQKPEIAEEKESSLTFVISGTLSHPRKYFEEKIKNAGHSFATSVTKNTDYLVTEEVSGSKYKKATQLNIPIINESKLMELLE